MSENEFLYEENDFGDLCGLVDIFPDIEPFLKDVTKSYEIAKADLDKKRVDGHIDGSDSDSGISADSYAVNGALLAPDMLMLSDPSPHPPPSHDKNLKFSNNCLPIKAEIEKLCLSNDNKLIKRPISFISRKCQSEGKQQQPAVYNIIPKLADAAAGQPNSKPNIIKSHSVSIKTVETKKDLSKSISKITPIKLLKSNDGFPLIVNDNSKKEPITYYEIKNSAVKHIKRTETPNKTTSIKNESDSCYNLFTSKNSMSDNIFLKEDSNNDDLSSFVNYCDFDLYDNKDESFMDISVIDDYKSSECPTYIDIYNANQGNKVLQSSSLYKNLTNCDGVLDVHHYDRMVKKQERMIKNRQAASLSRQRKKEYVERLEHKVEQQKQENHFIQSQINDIRERFSALEQENQLLKRDIQTWRERYYDLERQKLKQGINNLNKYDKGAETINKSKALKATAASTTILGIFIILTFNFNSLNSIVSSFYKSQNEKNIPIFKNDYQLLPNSFSGKRLVDSESRIGRTLFSIIENGTDPENLNSHICNNTSGLNINETLRLTRELNSWGLRFKAESVKVYDRLQNAKIKSQILNKEFESVYKKSKFRDNSIVMNKIKRKRDIKSGQLEIYPRIKDYTLFDNFINDIDRKPDTLYFVTFHSDNFIFPASNVNKNLSSPKITLFLPADIYQEDKSNYKMMKIECQVQNFTIVNLKSVKMP